MTFSLRYPPISPGLTTDPRAVPPPEYGDPLTPTVPLGTAARAAESRGATLAALYARIEEEIARGIPHDLGRRDEARTNDHYYCGGDLLDQYTSPWGFDPEAVRTLPIVRRVCDVLSANLYKQGPTRRVTDNDRATEFLNTVYRQNAIDAMFQEADALSVLGQVAAFEVKGMTGPAAERKPIQIDLWEAQHLSVWLDPDDARKPVAVATIDEMDHQRRIRLWTAEERVTFVTEKLKPGQTAGGRRFYFQDREENPYHVIPFAFVHFWFPTTYFWNGSPGTDLRKLNEHVNYRLSRISQDSINNRPRGVIEGADATYQMPVKPESGRFYSIPPNVMDMADHGVAKPEAKYIVCDFGYLDTDRDELEKYLDNALAMHGVPKAAVRMEQTGTASGAALVGEQLPLLMWSESRQRPFGYYERDLAQVVFKVAAAHARFNNRTSLLNFPVKALEAVGEDPELTLRWKSDLSRMAISSNVPFQEFLLNNYLTSRTEMIAQLNSLTPEEAEEAFVRMAGQIAKENELLAPPPAPGEPPVTPAVGSGTAPAEPADEAADDTGPETPAEDLDE